MLTPRAKSPLPENVPRGGSNPRRCGQRAQALPTELFRPMTMMMMMMVMMKMMRLVAQYSHGRDAIVCTSRTIQQTLIMCNISCDRCWERTPQLSTLTDLKSCLFLVSFFCLWLILLIIIIAFKGAIRDFLQSPHSAANCLQHVRSSGPGAIVCKSRATHRALITCKCHVTCQLVRRDSSAIKFDRV